jgi:hypothetical protein
MPTKTTPTDIRYEYMHRHDEYLPKFICKINSIYMLSNYFLYTPTYNNIVFLWGKYMNRFRLVSSKEKKSSTDDDHIRGCCKWD